MRNILINCVPLGSFNISNSSNPISRLPCTRSTSMQSLSLAQLADTDAQVEQLGKSNVVLSSHATIKNSSTAVIPKEKGCTFADLSKLIEGVVVCCQSMTDRILVSSMHDETKILLHDKTPCDVISVGPVYSPAHLDLGYCLFLFFYLTLTMTKPNNLFYRWEKQVESACNNRQNKVLDLFEIKVPKVRRQLLLGEKELDERRWDDRLCGGN